MKILLATLFVFLGAITNAQSYVTIPDPKFVSWLTTNYPSCMNGNQMDITCNGITGATTVDVSFRQITNLDGIQYFTSLQTLNCMSNQLTNLPALPTSLEYLYCSINQLTSLPVLPTSLKQLECVRNNLIALPALPSGLVRLACSENNLSALPVLSAALEFLDCSNNLNLNSLPALPAMLSGLYCRTDNLSVLPALPASVQTLDCSGNHLTSLPILPASLEQLTCDVNTLNNLPALPATLRRLHCSQNTLTTLPALPAGLENLQCSHNNLSALPALPSGLQRLSCTYNSLSSLPAIPASIVILDCEYNNITCFPELPSNAAHISLIPNPFKCLPNYVGGMDTETFAYPLCLDGDNVNNPYACSAAAGITGSTYKDNNADCIKNTGDADVKNILLKLYDNSNNLIGQTYSAQNGSYYFQVPPGTYTVMRKVTGMPFTYNCTTPGLSATVTLSNGSSLVSGVDFDVACKPGFDIGVVSISHESGPVFPGQIHTVRIVAGDILKLLNLSCANGVVGSVEVFIIGPAKYSGIATGALTPSSVISGQNIKYNGINFANINPQTDFGLNLLTQNTAQAGDNICITVIVKPFYPDQNISNNISSFCYTVRNSLDPNLKEVYPQNVMPGYDDWLTYNIHFQNTGTAPAYNIRVADTLNSSVDPTTFELLNYSHANRTTLVGNAINFNFADIMLADSASNVAGSIGSISYRVKMKPNLPVGTKAKNRAFIYFDYNAPVLTNIATATIENPCPGISTVLLSNVKGNSYQWQVDTGTGYIDIIHNDTSYAGSNSATLNLIKPPSLWYGYKYRCMVDTINTSNITVLKYVLYWVGAAGNQWENPLNWSCGSVPDANTDVVIKSIGGMSPPPTVNSNRSCRSLTIDPGGQCIVAPGFTLTVSH